MCSRRRYRPPPLRRPLTDLPPPAVTPQPPPPLECGSPGPLQRQTSSSLEVDAFEFNSPKPFTAHAPPQRFTAENPEPSAIAAGCTKGRSLLFRGEGSAKENAAGPADPARHVKVSRFGWQSPSFVSRQNSPMLVR